MEKVNQQIIKKITSRKIKSLEELANFKRQIAGSFKLPSPANIALLKTYRVLVKNKKIRPNKIIEKLLQKREVRTISGVAPIAVFTKNYPCPGKCVYCPTEKNVPKSYLSNEPAAMRAILCQFDPFQQVKTRLDALKMTGHSTGKVELIVMGGTWSVLPKKYQAWFIKKCFNALNAKSSKNLTTAQKLNERAKHRCVGLTLETRPDYIDEYEIRQMRELSATRVEMGVQQIDDKILKLNQRGHSVKEIINATRLLKDAGFKISYHLMPALPGSTPAKDLKMFKQIFSDQNFQPDLIKIYPCVVVRGSTLYRWWRQSKYQPYSDQQLRKLLVNIKKIIPPYVRITRLVRDIPSVSIEAGNQISNLREFLQAEMRAQKITCQCIRCREARQQPINPKNIKLVIKKYPASNGQEYFLSYESKDKKVLYAFLRLRFPFQTFLPELKNTCLIRELHTYGQLVPLKQKNKLAVQHFGLGKKLMAEAEKIARKNHYKKIAVISGVGVREYYQKLGYRLEGSYMVKQIK